MGLFGRRLLHTAALGELVRGICGLPQAARYPQGDPRAEGAIGVLPLVSGGSMRDRLVEWDGTRKTLRYVTEDSDLPVTKFEATLSVSNNLDGTSAISWSAIFDAAEGTSDDQAIAAVEEFMAAGLDALTALSL